MYHTYKDITQDVRVLLRAARQVSSPSYIQSYMQYGPFLQTIRSFLTYNHICNLDINISILGYIERYNGGCASAPRSIAESGVALHLNLGNANPREQRVGEFLGVSRFLNPQQTPHPGPHSRNAACRKVCQNSFWGQRRHSGFIRTSILDQHSGSTKITTQLDHISQL